MQIADYNIENEIVFSLVPCVQRSLLMLLIFSSSMVHNRMKLPNSVFVLRYNIAFPFFPSGRLSLSTTRFIHPIMLLTCCQPPNYLRNVSPGVLQVLHSFTGTLQTPFMGFHLQ